MKRSISIFFIYVTSLGMLAEEKFLFLEKDNEILPAEEAFGLSFSKKDGNIIALWNIKEDYYLYLNSISVKHEENEISFKYLEGNILEHEDEFFGKTKIIKNLYKISFKAIQDSFNTKIYYQGCSEKGFCYPVQSTNIY
tara:strand:- start:1711 stop:2127 length:417 start_codon:yes stop_codon:yes gene_type:complete